MRFDFETFSKFAKRAYDNVVAQGIDIEYSLDDVLTVFRLYFEQYECVRGLRHPNIRQGQIESIISAMPFIDGILIDLESYEEMISQHFKTNYGRCDYNVNHFFSGDIRTLRMYETCYRGERFTS